MKYYRIEPTYKKSVIESVTGITITDVMEDTMRTNQLILG